MVGSAGCRRAGSNGYWSYFLSEHNRSKTICRVLMPGGGLSQQGFSPSNHVIPPRTDNRIVCYLVSATADLLELGLTRGSKRLAEMNFDGLLNLGDSVACSAEIPASRYCDVSLSSLLFQRVRTTSFQQLLYVLYSRNFREQDGAEMQ